MRRTHGYSDKENLYHRWQGIKRRCYNKNQANYKWYGGRGIKMCDEWLNDYGAFRQWCMDHGYTDELTLDRIDVDGDYCPENCRLVSWDIQHANRSNNHYVTIDDETHTIAEWGKLTGISRGAFKQRLKRGWSGRDLLLPMGTKRK